MKYLFVIIFYSILTVRLAAQNQTDVDSYLTLAESYLNSIRNVRAKITYESYDHDEASSDTNVYKKRIAKLDYAYEAAYQSLRIDKQYGGEIYVKVNPDGSESFLKNVDEFHYDTSGLGVSVGIVNYKESIFYHKERHIEIPMDGTRRFYIEQKDMEMVDETYLTNPAYSNHLLTKGPKNKPIALKRYVETPSRELSIPNTVVLVVDQLFDFSNPSTNTTPISYVQLVNNFWLNKTTGNVLKKTFYIRSVPGTEVLIDNRGFSVSDNAPPLIKWGEVIIDYCKSNPPFPERFIQHKQIRFISAGYCSLLCLNDCGNLMTLS